jgi:hypothetical protein
VSLRDRPLRTTGRNRRMQLGLHESVHTRHRLPERLHKSLHGASKPATGQRKTGAGHEDPRSYCPVATERDSEYPPDRILAKRVRRGAPAVRCTAPRLPPSRSKICDDGSTLSREAATKPIAPAGEVAQAKVTLRSPQNAREPATKLRERVRAAQVSRGQELSSPRPRCAPIFGSPVHGSPARPAIDTSGRALAYL